MKKCPYRHTYDDQYTECPVCRFNRHLYSLMEKGVYGRAKNLADWKIHTDPHFEQGDMWLEVVSSVSAWHLGDRVYALDRFASLLNADINLSTKKDMAQKLHAYGSLRQPAAGEKPCMPAPAVSCNDKRVEAVMRRLSFVFSDINRPVRGYVAETEADYNAYLMENLLKEKWSFQQLYAASFSSDEKAYHIIFKSSRIYGGDRFPPKNDDALTGLCAHEMAHLELGSRQVPAAYFLFQDNTVARDAYIHERLTDLFVISKGLAWALWSARADCSEYNMARKEIELLLEKAEHGRV